MPELSTVHRLTAYTAWADDVMLKNAEQSSEGKLTVCRDTLFKSIAGTFDHTLVVAEIFKAHLEGTTHPHHARYRDEEITFPEIAQRLRAINVYYAESARRWTADDLAETITFEFVEGGRQGAMTREDILLHIVNHATYHRGFVSTLLYPLKTKSAASDLTVFLRDVWPNISRKILEKTQ